MDISLFGRYRYIRRGHHYRVSNKPQDLTVSCQNIAVQLSPFIWHRGSISLLNASMSLNLSSMATSYLSPNQEIRSPKTRGIQQTAPWPEQSWAHSLVFLCFVFFCSQPLWHQVWLHSLVNIVSPCIYTIIDSLYRCTIILFSISRCTEICTKKMYTILLYSAVVTIPHIFWVSQSPNLFWYGHTFVVPFPTSSARYHPPSLLGSALAKYFNFACFILLLCLQSCMGRVSYLLPPNIWVDGPSLLTVWKVGSGVSSLNKEQLHRPALRAHDHIYFVVIAMRSMIGSCDASKAQIFSYVCVGSSAVISFTVGGQTIVETASQWLPLECSTCTNSSLIMSNLMCDLVAHLEAGHWIFTSSR